MVCVGYRYLFTFETIFLSFLGGVNWVPDCINATSRSMHWGLNESLMVFFLDFFLGVRGEMFVCFPVFGGFRGVTRGAIFV